MIARDLGVSRRTVYHWIETGQLDRELDEERVGYGPRCLMPSKLDPYKPLIDTRLKEYPKLTAVRLFKEVRAANTMDRRPSIDEVGPTACDPATSESISLRSGHVHSRSASCCMSERSINRQSHSGLVDESLILPRKL